MDNELLLQKQLQRERQRREEAEKLLEIKSLELYETNRQLQLTLDEKSLDIQRMNKELSSSLQYTSDELVENIGMLNEYKKAIDASTIVSMADINGDIIYVNDAFVTISGYSREELIGSPHSIIRHPDSSPEVFKEMWATLLAKKPWHGSLKNLSKNKEVYYVDTTINPVLSSKGKIKKFIAMRQDITELIHLNETLENRIFDELKKNAEKSEYLLRQSRLAQMGEMISMIAHQWRQPLTSISSISATLSLDILLDAYNKEFFQERIESIAAITQHLSSTIDDFRNFYKSNKKATTTTIQDIVEGCLKIIGKTLEGKSICIEHLNLETPIKITTYENELKQVIINILKNAEDVFSEKNQQDAKIWISCENRGDHAVLGIEDNAGGIPEDILPKIFDPYFSTKHEKDGTGLGLYMSKTIIEEHCKGKISVHNTDRGAKFIIILPSSLEV
ncbi:PAS domain-containing sensor histidine kinase [Sulfurimonas aquatica]|nr:HAMP domain-containing sensor histidine kinase [Sulfurimonas aquatica]